MDPGHDGNEGGLVRVTMNGNAGIHRIAPIGTPPSTGPYRHTRRTCMTSNHERLEQATASFDELQESHQQYEQRLEELKKKTWLTPDEELEEKRLKKLKLQLKDQMASLRRAVS
jgi:uncharacterized protein YdcH (DUF465 family)